MNESTKKLQLFFSIFSFLVLSRLYNLYVIFEETAFYDQKTFQLFYSYKNLRS